MGSRERRRAQRRKRKERSTERRAELQAATRGAGRADRGEEPGGARAARAPRARGAPRGRHRRRPDLGRPRVRNGARLRAGPRGRRVRRLRKRDRGVAARRVPDRRLDPDPLGDGLRALARALLGRARLPDPAGAGAGRRRARARPGHRGLAGARLRRDPGPRRFPVLQDGQGDGANPDAGAQPAGRERQAKRSSNTTSRRSSSPSGSWGTFSSFRRASRPSSSSVAIWLSKNGPRRNRHRIPGSSTPARSASHRVAASTILLWREPDRAALVGVERVAVGRAHGLVDGALDARVPSECDVGEICVMDVPGEDADRRRRTAVLAGADALDQLREPAKRGLEGGPMVEVERTAHALAREPRRARPRRRPRPSRSSLEVVKRRGEQVWVGGPEDQVIDLGLGRPLLDPAGLVVVDDLARSRDRGSGPCERRPRSAAWSPGRARTTSACPRAPGRRAP